jgi:hypothetical protein
MKITREETTEWNYPCFGRAKDGDVVWFTEYGIGVVVRGTTPFKDGWNMDCFTPIDNPFEDKVEKFKPIKIVLETNEEVEDMYNAMRAGADTKYVDWTKLGNLLD